MVTGSPDVLLLVVVDTLVLGSVMGTSGNDEMMCLENQSDVSISDQQMMDTLTIQVQVTPLLRTDSVVNVISTHDSSGIRARSFNSQTDVTC
jgi:hypothetical protein